MTTQRITLPIYNLGCGGGGSLSIEGALTRASGVTEAYINPATEMAYIVYDHTLTNREQLANVIDRLGFGPPPMKDHLAANAPPLVTTPAAPARWDVRRQAIRVGFWLALIYIVAVIADLLFPNALQVYRLWERVLVGVTWATPWTLVLGLVESFLYGAVGAWILAGLFQAGKNHIHRISKPGV